MAKRLNASLLWPRRHSETEDPEKERLRALAASLDTAIRQGSANACAMEVMGEEVLPFLLAEIRGAAQKVDALAGLPSEIAKAREYLKLMLGDLDHVGSLVEGLCASVAALETAQKRQDAAIDSLTKSVASLTAQLEAFKTSQGAIEAALGGIDTRTTRIENTPARATAPAASGTNAGPVWRIEQEMGAMFFNEPDFFNFLRSSDAMAVGFVNKHRSLRIYFDALQRAFEFVEMNRIPGDVVEFGVYEGYTATISSFIMRNRMMNKRLFVIDSFEGFPEIESPVDKASYEVAKEGVWKSGIFAVDDKSFEAMVGRLKHNIGDRAHVVRSFFSDLKPGLFSSVAILHLDCDLYESTREALNYCWDNGCLQDGTVCLLDDYNCSRANGAFGQRRALDEFLAQHPEVKAWPWFSYGWSGHAMIFSMDVTGKVPQADARAKSKAAAGSPAGRAGPRVGRNKSEVN